MNVRPVRYCTFCDLELPIKLKEIGYPTRRPNANERSKATHVAYTRQHGGAMAQFACEAHAFRWMHDTAKDFFGPADPHLPTFPKDHYIRPIEEFWGDLDVLDAEKRLEAMDRYLGIDFQKHEENDRLAKESA